MMRDQVGAAVVVFAEENAVARAAIYWPRGIPACSRVRSVARPIAAAQEHLVASELEAYL